MAIFSAVPPPEAIDHEVPNTVSSPPPQSQTPVAAHIAAQSATAGSVDIEAWTVSALESLSVSPVARGTGTPLAINLDEQVKKASTAAVTIATDKTTTTTVQQTPIRRPLSRRDSQKKREQLLKGNEGSRARRRWENGGLPLLLSTGVLDMMETSPWSSFVFQQLTTLFPSHRSPHRRTKRAAAPSKRLGSPSNLPGPSRPLPSRPILGYRSPPAHRREDRQASGSAQEAATQRRVRDRIVCRRGAARPARHGKADARCARVGARTRRTCAEFLEGAERGERCGGG